MKKILSILSNQMAYVALIFFAVFPLLSLNSGSQSVNIKGDTATGNEKLREEIKSISIQIKVVDDQTKYKDSVDNAKHSYTIILPDTVR